MENVVKLSTKDLILEALGWIGLVIMFLVVLGIIGIIVISIYFYWEYGIALLLFGIGVILGSGYIIAALYGFLRTSPFKFVKCPYCGMKNLRDATFCNRCEKILPK